MRVICIDNYNDRLSLTIGKEYNHLDVQDNYYLILFDNGYTGWFKKGLFITKKEQRNKRLEEIGI